MMASDVLRIAVFLGIAKSSLNIQLTTAFPAPADDVSTTSLVADSTVSTKATTQLPSTMTPTRSLALSKELSATTDSTVARSSTVTVSTTVKPDKRSTATPHRRYIDNKTITDKEREAIRRFFNMSKSSPSETDGGQPRDNNNALGGNITTDEVDYYVNTSVTYFNDSSVRVNASKPEEKNVDRRPKIIYRPIGALSTAYKDSLSHWRQHPCYPRCHGDSSGSTTSPRRLRKHSNKEKKKNKHHSDPEYKKFHNSVLMHHNGPKSHRTTKYYAWIFGAAMVSLLCMLSVTGCVIFCICGERWNLRRPKTKIYNNSEYERVDSISSMVDQNVNHDTVYDPIDDDMTII